MDDFSFEKLRVWIEAKNLTVNLYGVLSGPDFPAEEKFNLASQMKRCAISIASNIAEGTVRTTQKDKQRFVIIAYGSAIELMNQLIISKELGFISEEVYKGMREKINTICAMLSGLRKSYGAFSV